MSKKLLWKMIKMEYRSILQRKLWMLLPILYGLSLIMRIVSDRFEGTNNLHGSMNQFHTFEFTLSLAFILLLGISLIRKDVIKPSYAWMNTLPFDRSYIWFAKWAAGIRYCFLYICFILIVYGVAGALFQVPVSQLLWNGLEHLVIYGLSYGLSITIGMTLGTWIRNRTVYIVGLGFWFCTTYMIDMILVGSMNLYPFRIIRLSPYYTNSIWNHELYGRIWGMQELLHYALFVIMLILVCSLFSIHKLQNREPGKNPLMWKKASLVGCILLIVSAVPYMQMWNERIGSVSVAQPTGSLGALVPIHTSIITNQTKIVLKKHSDERLNLDVSVSIQLSDKDISLLSASPDGVIEFKLDQPFIVEQVYTDGNSANFIRSDNAVYVLEPKTGWSSSHVMKFIYSMSGVDREYHAGIETITHAAVNDAIWLNANLHWIPVASTELSAEGNVEDNSTLAGSMVYLEFVGFRDNVYTSIDPVTSSVASERITTYEGVYGDGVAVWSGKFEAVEVKGADVVVLTTPSALVEAKQYASTLSEAIDYYRSWVKLPDRLEYILFMPMDHIATMDSVNQSIGNTLMFREYERNNLDEMRLFNAISFILFNDLERRHTLSNKDRPSVVIDIRNLMLALVNKKLHQRVWTIEDANDEINIRFEQAYNAGKEEQIKRILNSWYDQYGQTHIDMRAYFYSREMPLSENWYPIIKQEDWLRTWDSIFGEFQS